jgi:hypothetical protein
VRRRHPREQRAGDVDRRDGSVVCWNERPQQPEEAESHLFARAPRLPQRFAITRQESRARNDERLEPERGEGLLEFPFHPAVEDARAPIGAHRADDADAPRAGLLRRASHREIGVEVYRPERTWLPATLMVVPSAK